MSGGLRVCVWNQPHQRQNKSTAILTLAQSANSLIDILWSGKRDAAPRRWSELRWEKGQKQREEGKRM